MSTWESRSESIRTGGLMALFLAVLVTLTSVYGFGRSQSMRCETAMPEGSWFHAEYCAPPAEPIGLAQRPVTEPGAIALIAALD